jgi:hypothetical protein
MIFFYLWKSYTYHFGVYLWKRYGLKIVVNAFSYDGFSCRLSAYTNGNDLVDQCS